MARAIDKAERRQAVASLGRALRKEIDKFFSMIDEDDSGFTRR